MPPMAVCVLRSGGEYRPQHVTTLYRAVQEFWPVDTLLRFAVLTDYKMYDFTDAAPPELIYLRYEWRGWWAKMELFRSDLLWVGDMLFFDLDTVVVGDLTDIVNVGQLTCLSDFYRPINLASGLMYLPRDRRSTVWTAWDMGKGMRNYRGDQEFLRTVWRDEERWQHILPGQVVSYKVHVKPARRVPEGARVVCFHGKPRPWEVDERELYG